MIINQKPEERLDDLQIKGYKILQNPGRFCFGMDAVLLSAFADVKKNERALDLGTGTGIPLHSTNFDFEEDLLLSGFALYQALLTR